MSNRVSSGRLFEQRPGDEPMTKTEKRDAARIAKAKLQAADRRRKIMTNFGAAIAVVAVLVALGLWIRSSINGQPTALETANPAAEPTATATAGPFPDLPAGADPALGTKPTVSKGEGDLKELKVTTLIEGNGAAATAGKSISVNYVGVSYKTGEEFDSSWSRSQAFSFSLGQGGVIKGWDEGLVGVKVGSRVQIDIPSDKAYGDNPTGGQPAGALRFVVDVLSLS